MLRRLAAQCWLTGECIRQQVFSALSTQCSSDDVVYTIVQQTCRSHSLQQQASAYHTSCSSSLPQQPPNQSDSSESDEISTPTSESPAASAASDAEEDPPTSASSTTQHTHQQAEASALGFTTVSPKQTTSGYRETKMFDRSDASRPTVLPSLPEEQLRIQLRQEVKQEQEAVELDAYSFSRSLLGADHGSAAAQPQQSQRHQQQQQLTAADKESLEKLVGIMTKDGKKSRARRQLLEAMHNIKQQLAQGKNVA